MATWQQNAAREHLTEILDQAETQGPQIIANEGKQRAVVLTLDAYQSLDGRHSPETVEPTETPIAPKGEQELDFITFLQSIPKIDLKDWEIARNRREIDL